MKNLALAIAISVTLVLIVLGLGCAGPAPAALQPQAAPTVHSGAMPQSETHSLFSDNPTNDQAVLDDMQQATRECIADLIMAGQPVPDYQYAALRSIEDARTALNELQTQWVAPQTVIAEYIMAREPVPDYQYEALREIESARQTVLITHGLVD